MSAELSKLAVQQDQLLFLMDEVKILKVKLVEKDKKIMVLEKRVDELELYTRREDFVITGLETRHRSYARVTPDGNTTEDAPQEELQSLEQQVLSFLHIQSKAISI